MKCEVYQMISCGIQFSKIVIQGVTGHHNGAIMKNDAGLGTEHSMFGKEERYIPRTLDIGVLDYMMPVVVMEAILQGIKIDTKSKQDKDDENAGLFFHLRVIQYFIHK